MELHNPFSNITFMVSFLFLLVLFKIVKRWSCNSSPNLPPGPPTLPFIGNLHQIINNSLPHHCFKNLAAKYGPLMSLKLGEVPYVIVTSPEMAKEILKTNDITFSDRPDFLMYKIFSYNGTDVAFSKYGEHWRQLRKICVLELLSAKRVESFKPIREEEVSGLIKSISESEGSVVNLTQKIISMTYGIVTRATIGKKNRHEQVFISAIKELGSLLGVMCIADLYPSIKMLQRMVSKEKTKLEKIHRETDIILQDIIDDRKINHREVSTDEDIVDVLLKIQQENDHSQHLLTDDNIKSVILVSLQLNMLTHLFLKFVDWFINLLV
jgi:cytochrome P450